MGEAKKCRMRAEPERPKGAGHAVKLTANAQISRYFDAERSTDIDAQRWPTEEVTSESLSVSTLRVEDTRPPMGRP